MALAKHYNHDYFNELWAEAQGEFRQILADEKKIPEAGKDIPAGDRGPFMEWLVKVYFQYMSAYKKLDHVYDQIVHPQKRPLIRQLLDLTLARLLEYREVMVGTELSDFLYYDELTHYYKWMPEETDLPVPKYYYHEPRPGYQERVELLDQLLGIKQVEDKAKTEEEFEEAKETWMQERAKRWREDFFGVDQNAMILAIQTVERQRQALYKYALIQYGIDEEERERGRRKRAKALQDLDKTKAIIIIQKLVRGFLARRRVAKLRQRELVFLGLIPGPLEPNDERAKAKREYEEDLEKIERSKERRRRLQRMYQKNYEYAKVYLESKVRLLEAAEMAERMKFQIRKWMLDVKEKTGKLPAYPKQEHGGSKLIFCRDSLPPEILEKVEAAEKGKKKKKKGKKKDDKKKKKKDDKKKKKKKGKKGKKPVIPTKLEPAQTLEDMTKANTLYNKEWRLRNEVDNPEQKHEDNIIIREKRQLVGQQVRNEVDKLMRAELATLKQALEKKKGKKKKGKKGKKGKGKRSRGGKKGKGKKKGRKKKKKKKNKRGKDLTKGQPVEDLWKELVKNGIIKKCPNVRLDDLIGYGSIINETLRKYHAENQNPDPDSQERWPPGPNPWGTFGDVKRALKDICVLPMGSTTVHQIAPFTKSVMITGPKGSGKKSLVYAICNELRGTLYDLSPSNIVGKYPGKQGLKMLFHLLDKVGRYAQPQIIMIDPAEMQYRKKKVPKSENPEPKRIKKALSKFIKTMDPEDCSIVIGVSSQPWLAKMKPMKKDYQRFIAIPQPDHGDRLAMWRELLKDNMQDLNQHVNFELLSKLTDCWTIGNIKECARRTLKKFSKRLSAETEVEGKPFEFNPVAYLEGELTFKPVKLGKPKLDMDDFLQELKMLEPIYLKEQGQWIKWFNKTPLQKARLAFQKGGGIVGKKKKGKKGRDKKKDKKKKKKGKVEDFPQRVIRSPVDSVLGF